MTIVIGMDVQLFRGITLGLALGDEIDYIVHKDGLIAVARSPGNISAGVIRLNTEAFSEFSIDERVGDDGFIFGLELSRVLPFARGCQKKKGSTGRMKITENKVELIYTGARYRYLSVNMVETMQDIPDFTDKFIELCREIMENGKMITVPTKTLKQSLADVKKYMKSGEVRFVVQGERVMFEGADELSKFGFGLAAVAGLGEEKERMVINFSMDIMKDLLNCLPEAGDTANMFIVSADKPVVFQVPMPSGEALYAAVPRI